MIIIVYEHPEIMPGHGDGNKENSILELTALQRESAVGFDPALACSAQTKMLPCNVRRRLAHTGSILVTTTVVSVGESSVVTTNVEEPISKRLRSIRPSSVALLSASRGRKIVNMMMKAETSTQHGSRHTRMRAGTIGH